jgi:hypothetical protein
VRSFILTLGPEHVGRGIIKRPGHRPIWLSDFMGRVLPGDVGKRIYKVDGIYQVENNEQRDARISS